jgi:predicted transglutaminase-like cysteine proteinase
MWILRVAAIGLSLVGLHVVPATAEPINPSIAQDRASPWMRVFGVTQPPYGVVELCNREPAECREGPLEDARRQGTKAEVAELDRINRHVNREIEPVSDQDLYGVTEYWTGQPRNNQGDCEDYALVKRQMLIKAGWPQSALLLTVVLDEKGEGHAILTARTVAGDYVLDNKNDDLKVWHKTPYRFIMRQSYLNPRLWMSLDPKEAAPSVPMAGMRQSQQVAKSR